MKNDILISIPALGNILIKKTSGYVYMCNYPKTEEDEWRSEKKKKKKEGISIALSNMKKYTLASFEKMQHPTYLQVAYGASLDRSVRLNDWNPWTEKGKTIAVLEAEMSKKSSTKN